MFLHRVIHLGENLDDKVRVRSPKMLKSLSAVSKVILANSLVFSLNIILRSCASRVLCASYPLRRNSGRSGNGLFTWKARIMNWDSPCSLRESTCYKLQYDPYLISVACSYTEFSISVRFGRQGKASSCEKVKNFNRDSLSMSCESTCFWLQYDPSLISVTCC